VVYVWIRRTVDWADEEAFYAQLRPHFRPRVELWNRTFEMPFHLFRHQVAQIARKSFTGVEGAVVADWDEIPDGAIVAPVDDDDWLAPQLATVLDAERTPGIEGYRWPGFWVEVPMDLGHRLYLLRRRLVPPWPEKWFCSTNNYAVPKAGAESHKLLSSHMGASERFLRWRREARIREIETPLSVINRTLASQTTLRSARSAMSRSQLLRKYRRYERLYLRPVPDAIGWCRPYLAMMAGLMDRLAVRRAEDPSR
jgi:hypothetical protein